jgi:hypothetical protein
MRLADEKNKVIDPLSFYHELFILMDDGSMDRWLDRLSQQLQAVLRDTPHGDLPEPQPTSSTRRPFSDDK